MAGYVIILFGYYVKLYSLYNDRREEVFSMAPEMTFLNGREK